MTDRPSFILERSLEVCLELNALLHSFRLASINDHSSTEAEREETRRLKGALDKEAKALMRIRNAVIPPVARLPADILAYIFSIPFREPDWSCKPAFSLAVSGVSVLWRRIALETPVLWSVIQLGKRACYVSNQHKARAFWRDEHEEWSKRQLVKNKEWGRRSKAVPMMVDIGVKHVKGGTDHVQRLCKSLAAWSPRIEQLCFKFASKHSLVQFLGVLSCTRKHVKALRLTCDIHYVPPPTDIQIAFNKPFQRLEQLDFDGLSIPERILTKSLKELNVITYFRYSRNCLVPLLRSCAATLRHVTIERRAFRGESHLTPSVGTVDLPQLLSFTAGEDGNVADLLMRVEAPNSRRLVVDVTRSEELGFFSPAHFWAATEKFVKAVSTHLVSLDITCGEPLYAPLAEAFQHVLALQVLNLRIKPTHNKFLALPPGPKVHFPLLESMNVTCDGNPAHLMSLISAPNLRILVLDFWYSTRPEKDYGEMGVPWPEIEAFFETSSTHLRDLDIRSRDPPNDEIVEILRRASALQVMHLRTELSDDLEVFFAAMSSAPSTNPYAVPCRNLKQLHISEDTSNADRCSADGLCRSLRLLVQQRRVAVGSSSANIKVVTVKGTSYPSDNARSDLELAANELDFLGAIFKGWRMVPGKRHRSSELEEFSVKYEFPAH